MIEMSSVMINNPLRSLRSTPSKSVPPRSVNLSRGRINLFNSNSRGPLSRAKMVYRNRPQKTTRFSNNSRPGNSINQTLPKSKVSTTSEKIPGAYVVPPTNVANTYKKSSWSLWGGRRIKKTRKQRR